MTFLNLLRLSMVAGLLTIAGCQPANAPSANPDASADPSQRRIVAVSYPLQYLTQRLIGDAATVDLASGDQSPLTWRPDRQAIASMQQADLIVANGTGANYATWLVTVSLPDNKRVNTATKGLSLSDYIAVEDVRVVHSHGPEGEHSHATMVSRTWLDPQMAIKQSTYLAARLKDQYPQATQSIDDNLNALIQDLQAIEVPETVAGRSVFSANHQLKYLTRAAKISDIHLNLGPDMDAKAFISVLQEARDQLSEQQPVDAILVPDFLADEFKGRWQDPELGQRLKPIVIDMLDTPNDRDLLSRIQSNFQALESIPDTNP